MLVITKPQVENNELYRMDKRTSINTEIGTFIFIVLKGTWISATLSLEVKFELPEVARKSTPVNAETNFENDMSYLVFNP